MISTSYVGTVEYFYYGEEILADVHSPCPPFSLMVLGSHATLSGFRVGFSRQEAKTNAEMPGTKTGMPRQVFFPNATGPSLLQGLCTVGFPLCGTEFLLPASEQCLR